jgi:Ca2+-binding EF-hand superfamily protein
MDRIREKVRDKCKWQGKRAGSVFQLFDENLSGQVSSEDFKLGLRHLGVSLSAGEVSALSSKYGSKNGAISYDAFMHDVNSRAASKSSPRNQDSIAPLRTIRQREELRAVSAISNALDKRHIKPERVFSLMDEDSTGTLNERDFCQALASCGVALEGPTRDHLLDRVPRGSNGEIDYGSFLQGLKTKDYRAFFADEVADDSIAGELRKKRADSAGTSLELYSSMGSEHAKKELPGEEMLVEKLNRALFGRAHVLQRQMKALDSDRDGRVTMSEFRAALANMGLPLGEREYRTLCSMVESDVDPGFMDYRTFSRNFVDFTGADSSKNHKVGNGNSSPKSAIKERDEENLYFSAKNALKGCQSIKQFSAETQKPLVSALRRFETDESGTIKESNLRQGLTSLGVHFDEEGWQYFFHCLPMADPARVDTQDFVKKLRNGDLESIITQQACQQLPGRYAKSLENCYDEGLSTSLAVGGILENSRWGNDSEANTVNNEVISRKITSKLGQLVGEHGSKALTRVFMKNDRDGDGSLNLNEFRRALNDFGLILDQREAKMLMQKWDTSGDGNIDIDEFCVGFHRDTMTNKQNLLLKRSDSGSELPGRGSETPEPLPSMAEAKRDMRILQKVRGCLENKSTKISKIFRSFDANHDGVVSKDEFRAGMSNLNSGLTSPEIDRLIDLCDADGDGTIDYTEFASKLSSSDFELSFFRQHADPYFRQQLRQMAAGETTSPGLNLNSPAARPPRTKEELEDDLQLVQQISKKAFVNARHFQRVFEQLDSDADGILSYHDVRRGLSLQGISMNDDEFSRFVRHVDTDGSGDIDFHELFSLLALPSSSNVSMPGSMPRLTLHHQLCGKKEKFRQELSRAVQDRTVQYRVALKKADTDSDGKLSLSEFRRVLIEMGMQLNNEEFQVLSSGLSSDELTSDGMITIKPLVENSLRRERKSGTGSRKSAYSAGSQHSHRSLQSSGPVLKEQHRQSAPRYQEFEGQLSSSSVSREGNATDPVNGVGARGGGKRGQDAAFAPSKIVHLTRPPPSPSVGVGSPEQHLVQSALNHGTPPFALHVRASSPAREPTLTARLGNVISPLPVQKTPPPRNLSPAESISGFPGMGQGESPQSTRGIRTSFPADVPHFGAGHVMMMSPLHRL